MSHFNLAPSFFYVWYKVTHKRYDISTYSIQFYFILSKISCRLYFKQKQVYASDYIIEEFKVVFKVSSFSFWITLWPYAQHRRLFSVSQKFNFFRWGFTPCLVTRQDVSRFVFNLPIDHLLIWLNQRRPLQ